jgi:hypothetical protein
MSLGERRMYQNCSAETGNLTQPRRYRIPILVSRSFSFSIPFSS